MYRMRLVFFAILALGTAAAQAASYLIPPPGIDVIGEVKRIRTEYQDTFVDIARRYDVGYEELVQANPGVDPWLPGEGVELVIPTRGKASCSTFPRCGSTTTLYLPRVSSRSS